MTYHSSIDPLPAGERIGDGTLGGLIHETPMTLRYALGEGHGQMVEFAPTGSVVRGPEGLLIPNAGTRVFSLIEASKTFAKAEEAAGGEGLGDFGASSRIIEANSTTYYRAALPEGRFVSEQISAIRAWSPEELRTVLLEVSEQLQTAHKAGLFHGAISAEQVFLRSDGQAKLVGFGHAPAARLLGASVLPLAGLEGEAGDTYGLSELAYHLLTGQVAMGFAQRQSAVADGRRDPLVPPSEYASASEHRSLIQAIERGLDLSGSKISMEDWAFTVAGRTRIVAEGAPPAPGPAAPAHPPPEAAPEAPADVSPEAAPAPAPVPLRPAKKAPPTRPIRPMRGQPQQTQQGTPLATIAAFLGGLAVLTGIVLYVSQSGILNKDDASDAGAQEEQVALEEEQPAGPSPVDERAWVNARTIDTVASYTTYLERFPQGYYVKEAQERLDALDDEAWQAALAVNTLDGYRAYMEAFPLGRHVPEAQQIIDRLEAGIKAIAAADKAAFEEAKTLDTVAAYDGYLAAYPDGAHVEEARERREAVLEVARDNQAFAAAERLGTKAAYQSYINRFPKGIHVAKALTLLDKLTSRAGDVVSDCRQCPSVVIVPAGSFEMGAAEDDRFAKPSEKPRRKVTIADAFAIGQTEVTVGQWKSCVASGACQYEPRQGNNDAAPVVYVSWQGAQDYAGWLAKTTGKPYRLPSEAEWEYAARAGDSGIFAAGREASVCKLGNIAGGETNVPWRSKSCEDGVANGVEPVRQRLPNAYGLYDMIGNAAEWVADCDSLDYRDAPTDGRANERGLCGSRIARGGSWISGPRDFRLSARAGRNKDDTDDTTGFRVALTLPK